MRRFRINVDDELTDRLRVLAAALEMSTSELAYKMLQSCFTEQMHFIHTVKEMEQCVKKSP